MAFCIIKNWRLELGQEVEEVEQNVWAGWPTQADEGRDWEVGCENHVERRHVERSWVKLEAI